MTNLEDLQKRVIAFRDERDWKQYHKPKDTAISLLLEAAEFLEHFQWKSEKEFEDHITNDKEEIADELADVLYWVLLIAHDLNINLEEAQLKKMKKNALKYPISKSKGKSTKYTDL